MENLILLIHAFTGFASLLLGLALSTIVSKGTRLHRFLGKSFFHSMTVVFITALIILVFIRFSLFLTLIAFFSYYMAYIGFRVVNRKNASLNYTDKILSLLTFCCGGAIFIYSLVLFFYNGFNTSILLSLFFSAFTVHIVVKEFLFWRKRSKLTRKEIVLYHLQAMMGAVIASITAFSVQTGVTWLDWGSNSWILWLLPGIVLTPLILYWSNLYAKKY